MDADVVEICPPIHLLKKRKRPILCDFIGIDDNDHTHDLVIIADKVTSQTNKGIKIEAINQVGDVCDIDDDDLVIIGENVCKSNKGKTIEAINQVVGVFHNDDDLVIIGENVRKSSKGKTIEAINQIAVCPDFDYDLGFKNNHVPHSFQPSWPLEPYNSKIQGSTQFNSYSLQIKLDSVDHSSGMESSELSSQESHSKKKSVASLPNGRPRLNISLGAESSNFERLSKPFSNKMKSADLQGNPKTRKVVQASKPSFASKFKTHKKEGGCSSSYHANIKDEIMRKFKCLKKFNARDSPFCRKMAINYEYSQSWVKRIQKEWKILEKNLPDSIYVRVYESKMDVMRVVIIGAEGTPYHDGLFFFDLFFNGFFPNIPPKVNFLNRIGSSKLNPNFDQHGNVCLSLINTWIGDKNERWLPDFSTILQVLVSLQGLVLTAMPFLNAPKNAFKNYPKNQNIAHECHQYNKPVFIDSLWLMIHIIRRPPKGFEDFVVEHFCNRAHDIMGACKAYKEGAQVGSLVKSGFHDVYEGSKICLEVFKNSLREPMEQLVREFDRIGAKY